MQVLDGWSYAVGDVVLGTNPVSSDVDQVAAIEVALRDLLATFGLEAVLPHCVLAHVDVQAAGRGQVPGVDRACGSRASPASPTPTPCSTSTSRRCAGTRRRAPGASACTSRPARAPTRTNGHGKGFDMVIHESRKYGFARALQAEVAEARAKAGATGTAVGSPERRRRLHRTRGLPHARAARARLPRRHRDGQAPRPDDRARHLLDAAHGRRRSTTSTGASSR